MFEGFAQILSPLSRLLPSEEDIARSFDTIIGGTTRINQTFGQSRQRVHEFSEAIADTIPMVNRLGGTSEDALRLIDAVALSTKRNVVASKEEIADLFAAEKLTGLAADKLISDYQNIGIQFTKIGDSLEESIGYIQSVGANSKSVLTEMNKVVESINKYDFKDGVLGLTRMATQAQLLKIDMQKTLSFAEGVLSPEKAIETASAFQRLGVSVGTLTDPFQLMNKALTDPEGLQNSIVEMTKQFTYFDEKTKQFKINPQGMLMMRELKDVVGMSADELARISINAAEMDKRLSKISPSFEFENEEDRQYIANIAKMGSGGEYMITLTNEDDKTTRTIELQSATNEELKELVEQQKNIKQVDLSDLAKEQIGVLNKIYGAIDAEKNEFFGGVFSSKAITEALSTNKYSNKLIETLLDKADKLNIKTTTQKARAGTDEKIKDVSKYFDEIITSNGDILKGYGKDFIEGIESMLKKDFKIDVDSIKQKVKEKIPSTDSFDYKKFVQELKKSFSLPTSFTSVDINDMNVKNFSLPNPYSVEASSTLKPTTTTPTNEADFAKFANMNITTKKIEFGELPVFKVLFTKDSNFDIPTDVIVEEFKRNPNRMRELVDVMMPLIDERQPSKESVSRREI